MSGPVRTLLISGQYFPPQVGGISRLMVSLLCAGGLEEHTCLTGVAATDLERDDHGLVVYRRPVLFASAGNRVRRGSAFATVAAEIMAHRRPRAFLAADVDSANVARWFHYLTRRPYLVYAHGNEILDVMAAPRDWRRDALVGASRVVAVSRYTAEKVRAVGVPEQRIRIVPPGVDTRRFTPAPVDVALRERLLGERRPDAILLTVGNLVPRKGHARVIRALPELRARLGDVVYVIVGEGDPGPLRAEAEALHVAPHVVFAGCVQDEQLPRLYALGDVFVMVSSEHRERADVEGFGMVYLEASACARPVVGGDTGGVGDAIQHGTTGLLVDPDDTVALQGAICRLLQDRALAAAMGDAGRRRVEREFDWSVIASRLNEVVREVAG